MKDSSTGGFLAFLIAAPVVVICCGAKAAFFGVTLFGTAGILAGINVWAVALMALLGGIAILAGRGIAQSRAKEDQLKGSETSE